MVAAILGLGVLAGCGDDGAEPAVFCPADGLLGPNGETYGGRDPEQGCRWVDEEGKPLTTYLDGSRICYREGTAADFPCE
jgi:hypothetical protein